MYTENYKAPNDAGKMVDYERLLEKGGLGIIEPGQSLGEVVLKGTGMTVSADEFDRTEEPVSDVAATALTVLEIDKMLQPLDDREKNILRLRFGLDINTPRTLEEVGELVALTREEIRIIESRAMSKLRTRDRQEGTK